jgi:hypothetical protein
VLVHIEMFFDQEWCIPCHTASIHLSFELALDFLS